MGSLTKKIIIGVILLLVIGGLYFYYQKNNSMTEPNINNSLDQNTPTNQEKSQIEASFIKFKNLYVTQDAVGIRKYYADAGYSKDQINETISEDPVMALKEIDAHNVIFFPDTITKQIFVNKNTQWYKGTFEDNSSYVELSTPSHNEIRGGSAVTLIYTFSYMNSGWYLTEVLIEPRKEILTDLVSMSTDDYEKTLAVPFPSTIDIVSDNNHVYSGYTKSISKINPNITLQSGNFKTSVGPAVILFFAFLNDINSYIPSHYIKLRVYIHDIPNIKADLSTVTMNINHVYTQDGIDIFDTVDQNNSGFSNKLSFLLSESEPFYVVSNADVSVKSDITATNFKSIDGTLTIILPTSDGKKITKNYPFVLK